jgi:hypothetical protein
MPSRAVLRIALSTGPGFFLPAPTGTAGLTWGRPGQQVGVQRRALRGIPGSPPDLRRELGGCAFAPRCQYAFAPCTEVHPGLSPVAAPSHLQPRAGWTVACHLHDRTVHPAGPPPELDAGYSAGQGLVTLPEPENFGAVPAVPVQNRGGPP